MGRHPDLQVIHGAAAPAGHPADEAQFDPLAFQARCLGGFTASQVARGFSPVTIEIDTGVLDRFLALAG